MKTTTETHSFDTDLLASHFERGVWEAYVMKLKEDAPVDHCDVRQCRKRALEFNVHPIPVFCSLDEVKDALPLSSATLTLSTGTPRAPCASSATRGPGGSTWC